MPTNKLSLYDSMIQEGEAGEVHEIHIENIKAGMVIKSESQWLGKIFKSTLEQERNFTKLKVLYSGDNQFSETIDHAFKIGTTYRYFHLKHFDFNPENEERVSSTDLIRKDYCYACKTDKLVWNMMAARCELCNKIILGG